MSRIKYCMYKGEAEFFNFDNLLLLEGYYFY